VRTAEASSAAAGKLMPVAKVSARSAAAIFVLISILHLMGFITPNVPVV
jgi:hypothetical protein